MTTQISTQTISFYGSDLITLKVEDVIYTAVRPIVEALGLSWSTQQRKLENSKDKFNCVHMNTVAEDGKIRQMLCMPIKKLNGWLFSINPEKVRADLKEKVICYQEECFEALYNYWHFGKAERKTTTDERTGLRQAVSQLVSKKGLIYSDAYSLIHQRFNVNHIDELTLEQIPMAVEYVHKVYLEGELIIDPPTQPLDNLHKQLADYQELLSLLVKSFHFNNQAHELQEKAKGHYISSVIGADFGEHYFHNFNHPLRQHLEKVKKYIQSSSERIMIVQGMLNLLDEPIQIAKN